MDSNITTQNNALAAEISKLELEMDDLDQTLKKLEDQSRLLKAWQEYQRKENIEDESEDIVRAREESLKHKVQMLKKITGVVFTYVHTDVLAKDTENLCLKKRKNVEGHCGDVVFQLKMDIEETMNADTTVNSKITHLSITASENVYQDLKDTVEQLAEEGNAQGFLMLLHPYNIWHSARQKTYEHFLSAYPKVIKRPSLQVLRIAHPFKKCSFEITWKFDVIDVSTVVPDISLAVHVPQKVQQPNIDILDTVPEKFQLMLKELGIETSINALVALMAE